MINFALQAKYLSLGAQLNLQYVQIKKFELCKIDGNILKFMLENAQKIIRKQLLYNLMYKNVLFPKFYLSLFYYIIGCPFKFPTGLDDNEPDEDGAVIFSIMCWYCRSRQLSTLSQMGPSCPIW